MITFKQYIVKEDEEKRSGDSWQTSSSSWGGKNHDGDVEYYTGPNAKQMSSMG